MPSAPLDLRIEELRSQPGRTWGLRDAALGMFAVPLALLAAAGVLLALQLPPVGAATGATVAFAAVAVLVGRRAAEQSGGWEQALGFDAPLWSDSVRIVGWTAGLLLLRALLVGTSLQLFPALEGAEPGNTAVLRELSTAGLLVFAVLAVAVAPVVEELLFRGLVLRGLMMRVGFWPAALLSSAVFGLLHVTTFDASGVLVVASIALLGVGLCLLTRRTGRLGPAIGVHALHNAIAVLAVAVTL